MATDGEYELAKDSDLEITRQSPAETLIDFTKEPSIKDAVWKIEPAPEAIGPSISFEPGFSMRFPNGGTIMVKEGHFEIVGRCQIVDGDGAIISEFGGE